jgi:hypothetical protein
MALFFYFWENINTYKDDKKQVQITERIAAD